MKGVATHISPESCAVVREDGGEALTGERAGQPLSRERRVHSQVPTSWREAEGNTGCLASARGMTDLARSQTLRMHGRILHGNREIPPSSGRDRVPDRIGKSKDAR